MKKNDLEALLFVSKEPIKLEDIAKNEEEEYPILLRWILELQKEYEGRGIGIRQVAGGFQMSTNPQCSAFVEHYLPKHVETYMSKAQLETLTLVAYNQPVSRSTIAKYREVKNPDDAIQKLIDKNLIAPEEKGYVTTPQFLTFYGINDLKELPTIQNK
ncbi:SMC-Scp complex subunit ScpB (plasmid) [Pontibacillus sp. ALD_SL1]|uniref:SMC-Scp complex subunit ScpB n=1 Tax=Pontibacillus sp. ALD_SL1 TaxID=2777185 RepID=UPI001A979540|nr:SMC-Scp complex subunit ScpB [Pontibacillus sp. ALD_SL1]QST02340.1 SMC-Scp complex subunit ScpB [Pontibacillus sp. ALD_SL1]